MRAPLLLGADFVNGCFRQMPPGPLPLNFPSRRDSNVLLPKRTMAVLNAPIEPADLVVPCVANSGAC